MKIKYDINTDLFIKRLTLTYFLTNKNTQKRHLKEIDRNTYTLTQINKIKYWNLDKIKNNSQI